MTSTAPEQSEEPEDMPEEQSSQRIDKWLWAARFFKTRGLAAAAVSGGKVHLDEQRIKPSRKIRPGDCLSIRRGDTQWCLQVKALNAQRRPASEAASLYLETEAGLAQRAQDAEQRRAQSPARTRRLGRPGKHDRKELIRWKQDQTNVDSDAS